MTLKGWWGSLWTEPKYRPHEWSNWVEKGPYYMFHPYLGEWWEVTQERSCNYCKRTERRLVRRETVCSK